MILTRCAKLKPAWRSARLRRPLLPGSHDAVGSMKAMAIDFLGSRSQKEPQEDPQCIKLAFHSKISPAAASSARMCAHGIASVGFMCSGWLLAAKSGSCCAGTTSMHPLSGVTSTSGSQQLISVGWPSTVWQSE